MSQRSHVFGEKANDQIFMLMGESFQHTVNYNESKYSVKINNDYIYIYIYMLIKHFHIDHTYGVRLMGTREEGRC